MSFQPVHSEYIQLLLEHLSLDQSTKVLESLADVTQRPVDLRDCKFS